MRRHYQSILLLLLVVSPHPLTLSAGQDGPTEVQTFSIVAVDESTGELGVAVASRFFAVGSVVPWAEAGVGAVATQSFANTSFGWRGLALLKQGNTAAEAASLLLGDDPEPTRRQFGIVSASGDAYSYTGEDCVPWAGGRIGEGYAIQGNILTGESVVVEMEREFLSHPGTLAEKLYASLVAGDEAGGDSRGKQSAAMLVVKQGAGYGGYTDRAIDIRVDDDPEPFIELGRLLQYAMMNYSWNEAWTLFKAGDAVASLPLMEQTAHIAPENPEVWYDLAVIRLAAGSRRDALQALERALSLNPGLRRQARGDSDLSSLQGENRFKELTGE
ncbi:MAG: DUF1028 domain-containing protein [Ignavibacteria bacterium]|nr:DUF1028 domain-containing protein [Ignavibacteria bacterium]